MFCLRVNARDILRQSFFGLIRKLLSALCSAAGKNLAAVSVSHSFAEAVLHLAMTLLGLISSLHFANLRFNYNYETIKIKCGEIRAVKNDY